MVVVVLFVIKLFKKFWEFSLKCIEVSRRLTWQGRRLVFLGLGAFNLRMLAPIIGRGVLFVVKLFLKNWEFSPEMYQSE